MKYKIITNITFLLPLADILAMSGETTTGDTIADDGHFEINLSQTEVKRE